MDRAERNYEQYQRTLSLTANSEVGDGFTAHYFAVIRLAADLVHRFLGIGDPVEAEENIIRVFKNLISESSIEGDLSTRAMEYVLSWANANEGLFKSNDRESFGLWREGEYIGLYPHKLTEILKKENFSDKAVLRAWTEKKWSTERDDDRHLTCQRRKIEDGISKVRRFVVIPWAVYEKFVEE